MDYRFADKKDCGKILFFIKQLAEYEKMADDVVATEELLEKWIFDLSQRSERLPIISAFTLLKIPLPEIISQYSFIS